MATPLFDEDDRVSVVISLKPAADLGRHAALLQKATAMLRDAGLELVARNELTLVVTGSVKSFADFFDTEVRKVPVDAEGSYSSSFTHLASKKLSWLHREGWAELVENVSLEPPHLYLQARPEPCRANPPKRPRPWSELGPLFAAVKARPPEPAVDFHHLQLLDDVPKLLKADRVHRQGIKGRGVRVVMIDTGFAHGHPFFVRNRFRSKVCLASSLDAESNAQDVDWKGHGTAMSAVLFAVAPDIELIGIKLSRDDRRSDMPLLAPFMDAVDLQPDIISLSVAYDMRSRRRPHAALPADFIALERNIQRAIDKDIVVVAGAGNGQHAFPAQMTDVIAVGGVYSEGPELIASDFASAFHSRIYDREVPDCCGLVGKGPSGRYINLPLPPASADDQAAATFRSDQDHTEVDDGWAIFSGTSAAAPQVAGVCALLKQANPDLKPKRIKDILCKSATAVTSGSANPESALPGGTALEGAAATGAGLVDACRAWRMATGQSVDAEECR